jgi:cyclopropane fatty-acyl-phospholipid synthase-like methyltransferase
VDEIQGAPFSWLDIGAGYGEFVEALIRTLPPGSRIQGIEPMLGKVEQALRLNLPLSTQPLASIEGPFDAVSMINVFSHLPDFDEFLSDVRRVITKGGMLLLETGNGGDLDRSSQYPDLLCLPDHLVFAGVSHITTFLQRNGFELLAVHKRRLDTLRWMATNAAARLRGRDVKLRLPYSSPFRTVFFKARLI